MSRVTLLIVATLFVSVTGGRSISDFIPEENPIRQVVNSEHDLETSILQIIGNSRRALSFARFVHRYGKRYENVEEMQRRFQIFSETLSTVKSHDKKGLSYTMGVNGIGWELLKTALLPQRAITSLPMLSFQKRMLGEVKISTWYYGISLGCGGLQKDWRETGIVSPVKNQGRCGSCWTFSTTGALEAAYAQAHNKGISLSEQQLVDCAGAFNNFGCNGGLPSQAFEYIKYNGGLETEDSYPYTGKNGICQYLSKNAGVQVIDSVNITLGAEDELKHAVALVRPVSVAFEVVNGFKAYNGGVYTSTACGNSPMDVNHAVLAVGYGVENGVPYWLIKNSWGADWGDNGYFKMEMGKNMCGIATCASYPIVA